MLMAILQQPLSLVLAIYFAAFFIQIVKAQQDYATTEMCQTLWAHFIGTPNNNNEPSFCCNTAFQGLQITCNDQKEITALEYSSQEEHQQDSSTSIICDNSTVSILSKLTKIEKLTLNYYIDQSLCPSFFSSPSLFNHLTLIASLEIRGTQFSSTFPSLGNNTISPSINILDLSDSNFIPTWIPDAFPSVKNFILLGTRWQQGQGNTNGSSSSSIALTSLCGSLTNLTLDIAPSSPLMNDSDGSWLANCTKLTQLDIQINDPTFDVSKWLAPIMVPTLGQYLQSLTVATAYNQHQQQRATFPTWLSELKHLSSLSYHTNIVDAMPANILSTLPLTTLNLTGNKIHGDFPSKNSSDDDEGLSSSQLNDIDLSGNELTGKIPSSLRDTIACNLDGNPILCSGIGNPWDVCQHCNLVPSFGDIMRRYTIQWIVVASCLVLIVFIWIYILVKKHQHTSFGIWLRVFYSVFSGINLITMIVYLGIQIPLYPTTLIVLVITTGIYLIANGFLYRYCCHRFSILVIRRTWPVFLLCTLDLNNFALYEVRMLNLSAYRLPIEHRIPVVLSWIKVLIADIPHTVVAIYLMMLHAPVASVLLTCITSGLGIVRAIYQMITFSCQRSLHFKFHPMTRSSPDEDDISQSHHDVLFGYVEGKNEMNGLSTVPAESSTTNVATNGSSTTVTTREQMELAYLIK